MVASSEQSFRERREGSAGLALREIDPADPRVARLLDACFEGEAGVAREFPLILSRGSGGRSWAFESASGSLAAHAAVRDVSLVTPRGTLRASGIGLVATRPEDRGRGLATALVERCVASAAKRRREVALLFGSPRGLYHRLGFRSVGRERLTRVEPTVPTGAAPAPHRGVARGRSEAVGAIVRSRLAGDEERLLELLRGHPLRVERSADEFARLLEIPHTHLRVLEQGGRVRAYCIEGKGRDLVGVLHEWAGDTAAAAELIECVVADHGKPLWLLSPEGITPPIGGEERIAPIAQLRILDPRRFGARGPVEVFGDATTPADWPFYVWGLDSF